jgi:hypothetical protein
VTGATTLLGTVLNAACSGPKRLMNPQKRRQA